MKKYSLFLLLLASCIAIHNMAAAQTGSKKNANAKTATVQPKDSLQNTAPEVKKTDTVIPDRDVEFDLQKLSKLATRMVYGTPQAANGLVLLELTIDTTGNITSAIVRKHEEKKLTKPAIDAVKKYAKKYKLQPAIRNGKPAVVSELMVPVVFDLSIYDK